MLITPTSSEINGFELQLFNAIFEKTACMLRNRMSGGLENQPLTTKPATAANEKIPKEALTKTQIISNKKIWSKSTKMFRRIN